MFIDFPEFMFSIDIHKIIYKDNKIDIRAHMNVPHGILSILGESGGGKSSLLKSIAGLLEFDGKIYIPSRTTETNKSTVTYIPQGGGLLPHLTLYQNIMMPRYVKDGRLSVPKDDVKYNKIFHDLGIEGILNRRPGEVSGGQKQRAALARGLLSESDIILMDEPTTGLDQPNRNIVHRSIAKLKSRQRSIIVVTHDIREAIKISDNICLVDKGKVSKLYSPTEFSRFYKSHLYKNTDNIPRVDYKEWRENVLQIMNDEFVDKVIITVDGNDNCLLTRESVNLSLAANPNDLESLMGIGEPL